MMHEHDSELIAAIAEGEMAAGDLSAAEAVVASCEDCSTDLKLQREALRALQTAPPVAMSDLERATLHRNVTKSLAPAERRADKLRPVPWFQRLMPAMAAAAALLIVVGVGSILVDGPAADLAADPTSAATSDGQLVPAGEELAEDSGGMEFRDEDEAATTTVAAGEAAASPGIQDFGPISATDLEEVATQLKSSGQADDANPYTVESLRSPSIDPALICAEAAVDDGAIDAIGRASIDGSPVEIYRIGDVVTVYTTPDCLVTAVFD
jgi:hypothetical protein